MSIEKISIALPPEMVSQVRQAVETGEYASSSEVVRDWTYKRRLKQKGLEELRELWLEARKDNTPGIRGTLLTRCSIKNNVHVT